MTLKKKLISAAVLSAVTMGAAQATYLSEDGTGQVLLYPYYTTRGGSDTLITLVNTQNVGKAVKVRFLEGMNSKEVLDFNLYLSPYDVWTATITNSPNGDTGVPVLRVADKSCIAPMRVSGINGVHDEPFRATLLTETNSVKTVDRAKEGYVEVIAMGDINPLYTMNDGTNFLADITHAAGVPVKCAAVETDWANGTFPGAAPPELLGNTGGLFGTGTVINVNKGTDYSFDAVALKAFAAAALAHSSPGTLSPSLASGATVSTVITNGGAAQIDNWVTGSGVATGAGLASNSGAAAVSAVLTRQAVMNEFIIDPLLNAGTDWVVNFPTRRFHIGDTAPAASWTYRPFRKGFSEDLANNCEPVTWSYYNQEELSVTTGIDVSPMPTVPGQSLCWEVNVVTFKSTDVLGSTLIKYDLTNIAYNAGWAHLDTAVEVAANTYPVENAAGGVDVTLGNGLQHYIISDYVAPLAVGDIYQGLPTIGFAVQRYTNGSVNGVLSNYGGLYVHKYVNAF
jgi:hypothetical protein